MKRTQWTALFADIRKTIVSFVSIALFVALGIGVFLGIKWNEPAIAETSKQYYNKHSYHDLLITFPYGVTEDDLAAVKEIEGVADARGSYSAYGQAYAGDERYVLVIKSLTEGIDVADILEGTRPSAKNEIGIEKMFADAAGLKVGDRLTVDTASGGKSYLYETEFTITAVVEHPSYIRNDNTYTRGICDIGDGTVDFYVLASEEAFNSDTYDNCFSELLVRGAGFDGLIPFGDEYGRGVAEYEAKRAELQAGYDEICNTLSGAGFSTDMDVAVTQINDKIAELEGLKARATEAAEALETALGLLEQYENDPDSLNIEELSSVLLSLGRFIASDDNTVSQIRTLINNTFDLVTEYIQNPSSLTESERALVETLVLNIEGELTAENAELLQGKIYIAQTVFEMYVAGPEAVSEEDVAGMIELVIQMGFTPDLAGAADFLNEKAAELDSRIAEIENGLELLRRALDGIEQYKSGEILLANAEIRLENAAAEIQQGT